MSIAKIQADIQADIIEQAFYLIGNAQPEELREIERMIPILTPDEDERAELLNHILARYALLNAAAIGRQIPRWGNN